MTDVRHLGTLAEPRLDDEDYIVKLLSKLQIVKWAPPKSLGSVTKDTAEYVNDLIVDYKTLPVHKFKIGVQLELAPSSECGNAGSISKATQEALNLIFPPQEWVEKGNKYLQQVSTFPTSRMETTVLQESIRQLMIQAQARIEGVCPVRENITMRCFDEMIRLATIDSTDRGLLLQDVRDETRMTLICYKALLQSAIDFGAAKFQQNLETIGDLHEQVDRLLQEKEDLQKENQELRIKMKLMDRQFTDERQATVEYRKNKLLNLKRTNEQFIAMLDAVGVDKNQYRHLL
jgi:regulator of replication initiation timing